MTSKYRLRYSFKRKVEGKILGVYVNENLNWDRHIMETVKSCYGTLALLRKIKRLTTFQLRKQLAECLVLSKLVYCNVVFDPLTNSQRQRLQKVQNCTAAFVLGHYCHVADVVKLRWLQIKESVEYNIAKLCFKSLYNENFPDYLKLQMKEQKSNVRRCQDQGRTISHDYNKNSFSFRSAEIFNNLPKAIRNIENEKSFCTEVRKYLSNAALARTFKEG